MPCYQQQSLPAGVTSQGRVAYPTQTDCLNACKEGACCEGATCSVKPQCQCQGAGKTFKGVGTTCESTKGACCTGTSCAVVSECECVGTGKTFNGVGTTCTAGACAACPTQCGGNPLPDQFDVTVSGFDNPYCFAVNGTWTVSVPPPDAPLSPPTCLFWRKIIPLQNCQCPGPGLQAGSSISVDMRSGNSLARSMVVRLSLNGVAVSNVFPCLAYLLTSPVITVPWPADNCPLPLTFSTTLTGDGKTADVSFTIPAVHNPLP